MTPKDLTLNPVGRGLSYRFLLVVISTSLLLVAGCGVGLAPSNGTPSTNPSDILSPNQSALDFGSVNVGSSATKSITITNTGTASIGLIGVTVTGNYFTFAGIGAPTNLSPSQSITASVKFAPSAAGVSSGSLVIATGSQSTNLSIPLSGTAVSGGSAKLSASPASVSFGTVTVGSTSSQTVTLANLGSATATVSSAGYSGPGFSVSGLSTPFNLTSGQSIKFTIGFVPSSSGTATGSMVFKDSSGATMLNLPISGTSVVAAAHSVDLTWQASTSPVQGYRVYRGSVSGGPYSVISSTLVAGITYTDNSVQGGNTYYYVVTAVSGSNQESGYSNQVTATIPFP